jgi:hypothetical protein
VEQQLYRVTCECGKTQDVNAGTAGGTIPCACGKSVTAVRSFETPLSEYDAKLRTGQLPVERKCVKCGSGTDHSATVRVNCKQKYDFEFTSRSTWAVVLLPLFWIILGPWLVLFAMMKSMRERGVPEVVEFDFPVRVCPVCAPQLADDKVALSAVKQTPLYSDILSKHSWARIMK